MKSMHPVMVQAAKDGIILAIKGRANIVLATRDAVSRILATNVRDAGGGDAAGIQVIGAICLGAIRGAQLIGADLGQVAKGIMLGVLGVNGDGVNINLATVNLVALGVVREVAQFGGEIAALISNEGFQHLDAPVRRVGSTFTPIGFNRILEKAILPDQDRIYKAAKELLEY